MKQAIIIVLALIFLSTFQKNICGTFQMVRDSVLKEMFHQTLNMQSPEFYKYIKNMMESEQISPNLDLAGVIMKNKNASIYKNSRDLPLLAEIDKRKGIIHYIDLFENQKREIELNAYARQLSEIKILLENQIDILDKALKIHTFIQESINKSKDLTKTIPAEIFNMESEKFYNLLGIYDIPLDKIYCIPFNPPHIIISAVAPEDAKGSEFYLSYAIIYVKSEIDYRRGVLELLALFEQQKSDTELSSYTTK